MTLTLPLRRLWAGWLDLLYPPRCGGCGTVGEGVWCAVCQQRAVLYRADQSLHILAIDAGHEMAVISAAPFASPIREMIHSFKYEGDPNLDKIMGVWMAAAWAQAGHLADAIVPVPLHHRRRGERGYNQSELLAQQVSAACSLPIWPNALKRIRYTEQQAHLGAAERQKNLADAFRADEAQVRGKCLVLVDDVFTTGATIRECAKALLESGAYDVCALTLTRA